MFKNEYQGGPCVEVFSAQGKEGKHSQWKLTGSGIKKVFDKEVKSFIFTLEGTTSATKIQLPKEVKQTLGLTQGILVLQIFVPLGLDLAVELGVLDSADQKCRLALSTAFKEMQVTALHVKIPLALIKRAVWLNLCIDLRSLVQDNLKSSSFKSLESICVSGNCKLRRIFTMRNQAPDTTSDEELYDINAEVELETIPKQCQLAADVLQQTQVINFMKLQYYEGKGKGQPDLPSTNRNGLVRDTDLSSGSVADGQVSYRIAFGSKVPVRSRRAPLKEGNTTGGRPAFVRRNSDASAESSQVGLSNIALCGQEDRLGSGTLHKKLKSEVKAVELTTPAIRSSSDHLKTSHTCTGDITATGSGDGDQDEDLVVVKPHPPRKPSSEKPNRRRLRVKSTSNDPIPAVNSNDGVLSSGSVESQKVGGIASKKSKEKNGGAINPPSNPAETISDESDIDSSDSMEYNEIIKSLNKNKLDDGDKENLNKGHKVYVFSSRPTCIDTGRTRTKHPRKQGMASAPSRKMHDSELRPNITRRPVSEKTPRSSGAVATDASYDQDFQLSVISHLDRFEQSPEPRSSTKDHRADGRNGDTRSSTKSQTRQSINRKSLREIPIEELQRSGGQKPYSFAKYQMGDVTESFEQQMLLSMQRAESASEAVESEDDQSPTHLPLGYEAMTDSSDDLSTHKSPKMLKNRSHNYQDEISNLGQDFMSQSNPRDWADIFSPPIVLPSSAGSRLTNNGQTPLHMSHCPTAERITDKEKQLEEEADTDEELDLLYDPELHYFYDPHTSKYYELITPGSNPKANAILSRQ